MVPPSVKDLSDFILFWFSEAGWIYNKKPSGFSPHRLWTQKGSKIMGLAVFCCTYQRNAINEMVQDCHNRVESLYPKSAPLVSKITYVSSNKPGDTTVCFFAIRAQLANPA